MIALDVGIVIVAAFVALIAILNASRGLAPVLQLRRRRSRRALDVVAGPVEVAGKVRAVGDPLRALDGRPITAALWRVSYSYQSGKSGKLYAGTLENPVFRVTAAEIVDSTGACPLGLGHVVPIGPERSYSMDPHAFATAYPEIWEQTGLANKDRLTQVRINELAVHHDVDGVVSGVAIPDDTLVPSHDYRSAKQRMRIVGSDIDPLLLSGWNERVTQSYLIRPSLLLFGIAGLAIGFALCFWLARGAIYAL